MATDTTYHFCTLFDRHYLYKGLAMHHSLMRHCPTAHLWILCMDNQTKALLTKLRPERTTLIRLKDFEDKELLRIKPTRTAVEYCWTITPSLPLYLLRHHKLPAITYVDADVLFFSAPDPVFAELGNDSISLTEHRFPAYLQYKERMAGRYNVQFMTFRHNKWGIQALTWWREQCLNWCFFRYEDGKLGDQLYLNDWHTRFQSVHVVHHLGAGLAPWNAARYRYHLRLHRLMVNRQPVVFYHFHGFKLLSPTRFILAPYYWLPLKVKHWIYQPYVHALQRAINDVAKLDPQFAAGFSQNLSFKERLVSHLYSVKLATLEIMHG